MKATIYAATERTDLISEKKSHLLHCGIAKQLAPMSVQSIHNKYYKHMISDNQTIDFFNCMQGKLPKILHHTHSIY